MQLKFVEVGHPVDKDGLGGNWGKFAVGRWTVQELGEKTQFPGCEGQRIASLHGWGGDHVWLFDLQTGESARFYINNPVPVDVRSQLKNHQIWVCPMFEPFMVWLWSHIRLNPSWWDTLPRTVELPADTPFEVAGFRRPGPNADLLERFDRIEELLEQLRGASDERETARTYGGYEIAELTPELVERLAEEAEAGYPLDKLTPRPDDGRKRTDADVQAARNLARRFTEESG